MSFTDDQLIPIANVCARYGGRSHMWIERRLHDGSNFPRPVYIARRRYWRVADLVAWEQQKIAQAAA